MADHLASIYGTEKDKVNCSFYFKIGACRHGDRCSRKHIQPNFSQTVLIPNAYINPGHLAACTLTKAQLREHFEIFYEDMWIGLFKYGEIEEINVCDNVGEHLAGNVYVRFKYEEDAAKAVEDLNNRFYDGRPLWAELSPVTDFGEACCRQYEQSECNRGGFCNFMFKHVKTTSRQLRKELYEGQLLSLKILKPDGDERSRSPPPRRERKRSRERDHKDDRRNEKRGRDSYDRRERSRDRYRRRSRDRSYERRR